MNKGTFKSIKSFFSKEQKLRGNLFTGESMITAKSFAKGAVIGLMGGKFTTERTFNSELKNRLTDNYVRRMCKQEIREISKSEMIEYLNIENERIEERQKSLWKPVYVADIKIYQRAKSYYDALCVYEKMSIAERELVKNYGK